MPYKRLQVVELSADFRRATRVVEVAELPSASADAVVVKNTFVGINATDVNITSGMYTGSQPPPFGSGLDAVGVVTEVGSSVKGVEVGDAVAYKQRGAFAEYNEVGIESIVKVPTPTPEVLPVLVCGSAASISLEQVGKLKSNETVLVTAAAGGTGQFVVQLAKLAGNHVIGTTSSDEKAEYLKSIGCDRVINYNKENVGEVLKKEYPNGVDFVFETVGGEMFKTAVENVVIKGRILVLGHSSGYLEGSPVDGYLVQELMTTLRRKSVSLLGFGAINHREHFHTHVARLLKLIAEGKLRAGVDSVQFEGLENIADAVDYLFARKNIGKIVVKVA